MNQNEEIHGDGSLDRQDRALIEALRVNARASLTALARTLGLSRTTVQSRLARLEKRGIVTGYTVRVNPLVDAARIRATVNLTADPKSTPALITGIRRIKAVRTLYTVSGKIDFIAEVYADNVEQLERVIQDIGEVDGVTGTETFIILATKFDRR